MKLLFLTKRFGSGKDNVLEDFGRQIRLAQYLVKAKNDVHLIAADYKKKQRFEKELHKIKISVRPLDIFLIYKFIRQTRKKICFHCVDRGSCSIA